MQRSCGLFCQQGMKHILFTLLVVIVFGCNKNHDDSELREVSLAFTRIQTPAVVAFPQKIISAVKVSGHDLCYRFTHFEIKHPMANVYEIYAKGTYPARPTVCLQAIYTKDTTVQIQPTAPGQYILRFYNQELYKTDTVQVN
jgi:hypothetical protein